MKAPKIFLCFLTFVLVITQINGQISVSTNSNTTNLVQDFLGPGITLQGTPSKFCNTIKLAIADVSDPMLDSYVMLRRRSFRSQPPTTLDLRWGAINVQNVSKGNRIQWITEQEEDIQNFVIEHSLDGRVWEAIGKIKAMEGRYNNYAYTDELSREGVSYYRIKAVEYDGAYHYSVTKALTNEEQKASWTIYPTLLRNEVLHIEHQEKGEVECSLYNFKGDLLQQQAIYNKKITLDLNTYETGMYIVKLKSKEGKEFKQKIVKY